MGASEVSRQARWMEELGYEYISVGEHYMRGNPPGPSHASLPLLGVAAGATEKIRVLSSILLAPLYHPVVLARMTATLDIASSGRLTLGVGVGGEFPVEFEAIGLKVKQRGRRTDECLDVLLRLWRGEEVNYEGRHFQLNGASINPTPAQIPHPPIWVSGRREAAMLRAVRFGDGWMPYFYSPERYQVSVAKINQLAHFIYPSTQRRKKPPPLPLESWVAGTFTVGISSTSCAITACWVLWTGASPGFGSTLTLARAISSLASFVPRKTGPDISRP